MFDLIALKQADDAVKGKHWSAQHGTGVLRVKAHPTRPVQGIKIKEKLILVDPYCNFWIKEVVAS